MPLTTTPSISATEAIETRRSIRDYRPEPIPREDLTEILRLASLAPSANNVQPWRFVVVTDPAVKAQLQAASNNQKQVGAAPVVIAVISDMEDTLATLPETVHPGIPADRKEQIVQRLRSHFEAMSVEERGKWGLAQANIAFGFLMIATSGLGYSTVPMLGFDAAKVREILGLPEYVQFAGLVPLGRAAEPGYPHHRHSLDRIVTYR